jgi:hypothetical protein
MAKRLSSPYQWGAFEYHRGAPLDSCPCKPGSKRMEEWKRGWLDAQAYDRPDGKEGVVCVTSTKP